LNQQFVDASQQPIILCVMEQKRTQAFPITTNQMGCPSPKAIQQPYHDPMHSFVCFFAHATVSQGSLVKVRVHANVQAGVMWQSAPEYIHQPFHFCIDLSFRLL
jgi:hypothetical protein